MNDIKQGRCENFVVYPYSVDGHRLRYVANDENSTVRGFNRPADVLTFTREQTVGYDSDENPHRIDHFEVQHSAGGRPEIIDAR